MELYVVFSYVHCICFFTIATMQFVHNTPVAKTGMIENINFSYIYTLANYID